MTHYPITAEQIRKNLQKRIDEYTAELKALKGVTIDTKHKTLTNRAISGEGARVDNYIGDHKALYVSYAIKWNDGGTSYRTSDIHATTYMNEDNTAELGTNGFLRIKRTMTPIELNDVLKDVIQTRANTLGELQSEYRRAESIAKKRNALVEKVNVFNDSVSYASEAQL